MLDTVSEIITWCFPLMYVVLTIVVSTRKELPGKPFLVAFCALNIALTLSWRMLFVFDRFGIVSISDIHSWFSPMMNILTLLVLLLLLRYILIAGKAVIPLAYVSVGTSEPDVPHDTRYVNRTAPMSIWEALFTFKGRMSRSDYWLKGFLPLLPISILNNVLALGMENDGIKAVVVLVGILCLWPGLALMIKRLHDRNRSGWLVLSLLIPIAGVFLAIWIMIEVWFIRGTIGENRFGNDPVALQ